MTHRMFIRPSGIRQSSLAAFQATIAALLLMLSFSLTGCGIPESVQNVSDAINRAVDELHQQPAAWRSVLQDAVDKLHKDARDVAEQIQGVLENSVAFAADEATCHAEWIAERAATYLIFIRDRWQGKTQGTVPPAPPA